MEERTNKRNSIVHYLPEDVLCQIFSRLDHIDLKSASLVCKLFCSVSSSLLKKLILKSSSSRLSYFNLQRRFKRFSSVQEIRINFRKLDNALLAITKSDLNLERLELSQLECPMKTRTIETMSTSRVINSIKSLNFSAYRGLPIGQVIRFINLFPSLIELAFSYEWKPKYKGIHKVLLNIPNVRKITHNWSPFGPADRTLDILSSTNCPKLESVDFGKCTFTPEALFKFFCNNPQLTSVYMPNLHSPSIYKASKVVECIRVLRRLNHLSLAFCLVQDAVLIALAESRPTFKSLLLDLPRTEKYTMAGLSQLLSACPGLESLEVSLPYCQFKNCRTYDEEMSMLVHRLPKLKHIKVLFSVVCQATLFSLVQNCPLLETIVLLSDGNYRYSRDVYCDQGMTRPTKKNYSIKSIKICPWDTNIWLWETVESYCPNLRK
ncbi:hypothetical protein QQ045_018882 [Rhodiola kirilowii]